MTNCGEKIGHQYLEITLEGFFLKKKKKKDLKFLSKENMYLTRRNHKRANSALNSYFPNLHTISICSHQRYLQATWQVSTSLWLLLWVRCPAFVCVLKILGFNTLRHITSNIWSKHNPCDYSFWSSVKQHGKPKHFL